MKFDLVVTRHAPLITVLIERGIIDKTTPVVDHVSDPNMLEGLHVIGVLPHSLSARCATITEVPMALSIEDRKALSAGDLSIERTREVAGEPVTYSVRDLKAEPVTLFEHELMIYRDKLHVDLARIRTERDALQAELRRREPKSAEQTGEFMRLVAPQGMKLAYVMSYYYGNHPERGGKDKAMVLAVPIGSVVPEDIGHGERSDTYDYLPNGTLEWDGGEWIGVVSKKPFRSGSDPD